MILVLRVLPSDNEDCDMTDSMQSEVPGQNQGPICGS